MLLLSLSYTLCSAIYSDGFGCLLITLANRLDRGQVGLDLDPKMFDILMVFLTNVSFEKVDSEKLISRQDNPAEQPNMHRVKGYVNGKITRAILSLRSSQNQIIRGGRAYGPPPEKSQNIRGF